jgi:hypothetical protein
MCWAPRQLQQVPQHSSKPNQLQLLLQGCLPEVVPASCIAVAWRTALERCVADACQAC